MRKYYKNQCIELVKSLTEAHSEIAKCISKSDTETAAALLEQCQQGAITIGEMVEASEGEGTEAVSRLESYCELTYNIHEDLMEGNRVNPAKTEKKLRKIIRSAQNSINALPAQFEAVFLPYKASMWDSLESIWMAADEDENCDAYVIPIPYYDKNPDGGFAKLHYEADQYPDYVPIVNYGQYNLEERHPDMIFIHNPFDDWNIVTSVHPNFYSNILKQYTDCLVYVPYYATFGQMSEGQGLCPAYINADYIVVQSKEMIEQYDKSIPREKFMPLGSPKFDRVIRLCENPPEPPAEWKERIEGKRVFFFNTSIGGMLADTRQWLKKVRYVFDTFKEMEDACLLWRPHPLLESTFESMRRGELPKYVALKNYFLEEDIGILDTTSDVEVSIAHSDAYIGEIGSSIVSLFEIALKPVYILDYSITKPLPERYWEAWYFYPLRWDGQNKYCLLRSRDLYVVDKIDEGYYYRFWMSLSDDEPSNQYLDVVDAEGKAFAIPGNHEKILVLDEEGVNHEIILRHHKTEKGKFWSYSLQGKYLWLFPNYYPDIVRIDVQTEAVEYIADVTRENVGKIYGERTILPRMIYKGELWLLKNDYVSFRIINIDTLDERYEENPFEEAFLGFAMAKLDDDILWAIPYRGTEVKRWDTISGDVTKYDLLIDGIKSIDRQDPERGETDRLFFGGMTALGDDVVFSPAWGNKFVRLNAKTGAVSEWHPPFDFSTDDMNEFCENFGMGGFWPIHGEHNEKYISHHPLGKTLKIDMENGTFTEVPSVFRSEDIGRYFVGFLDDYYDNLYYCSEHSFNTLKRIIQGKTAGEPYDRERQRKNAKKINISQDGNAGRAIYEYLAR